jgi:CheY-like chemotaxis protein
MGAEGNMLILVVEDNPADANLIQEAIAEEQLSCVVEIVVNGRKAIDFIDRVDADDKQRGPDLVLLDLNLPHVSGEKVLERIRHSARCGKTKVLIVSSSNAHADRERVMTLGATGYFRKPPSLSEFMKLGPRIREMLLT